MNAHAPIDPEFEPPNDPEAYDKWFRERVARSLADPRPSIPHEEVVAGTKTLLDSLRRRAENG